MIEGSSHDNKAAGDAEVFYRAPAHAAIMKDSQSAVVLNATAAKAAAAAAQSAVKRAELAKGEAINAIRDDFRFILDTVASRSGSSSSVDVDVPLSTGDGTRTRSVVVNGVSVSTDMSHWTEVTNDQTKKLSMVPDDAEALANEGYEEATFHTSNQGLEDYKFRMRPLKNVEDGSARFEVLAFKSDRSE